MRCYERYLRNGRKLSGRRGVLFVVYFLSLIGALSFTTPFFMYRGWWLDLLACLIAGIGFVIRWNASKCHSHDTMEQAVAGGIWSAVRFPYYLSDLLLIYSVSVYGGMVWYLFFIVPVSLAVVGRIIAFEEHVAINKYGEEYLQWCRNSGALIPRLFGWSASRCRTGFIPLMCSIVKPLFVWSMSCLVVSLLKNYRMDFIFRVDYLWLGVSAMSGLLWILIALSSKNKS